MKLKSKRLEKQSKLSITKPKNIKSLFITLLILLPYLFIVGFLIITPLVLILVFMLSSNDSFSFSQIERFFTEPENSSILLLTTLVSLLATLICVVVSIPTGYFISKLGRGGRLLFLGLISIPMWLNMVLKIKALNTIFVSNGFLDNIFDIFSDQNYDFRSSWPIISLGLVFVFIPFAILPIYNSVVKLDNNLILASYDLGCNKFQTFYKVFLPLIYPGIHTGFILVFLSTAIALSFSPILTDNKIVTIGGRIATLYDTQKEYAAAISIVAVIFFLALSSFSSVISSRFKVKARKISFSKIIGNRFTG